MERGSPQFFAEVEAHRYSLEPHIPEIVQFDSWDGKDVLEAGCGIATDGINFTRSGARYTALDFSPDALELARQRFALESRDSNFVLGSITELPFDDESFDLVFSHGVIHHIHDTEQAIAEFHRVLKPGGTALVMVYHRRSLNYYFTIMTLRRLLIGLLQLPKAPEAIAKLTGEDLSVLERHRELLKAEGLKYLRDAGVFLSRNTDGPDNTLSKVYSRQEVIEMFGAFFPDLQTDVRFLNLRIYPGGQRLAQTVVGKSIEKRIGWHLYIRAIKSGPTLP